MKLPFCVAQKKSGHLELTKFTYMKYALSEGFTAKEEGAVFWRKFDGRNQFRVIADNFLEVFAQWVVRDEGGGYTRYWPYNQGTPVLTDGEQFEGTRPQRKVCFVVSPVEGNDKPAPVILIVNQSVAEQMLMLATELQGLCVADFVILATGTGKNKQYSVRAMDPTPLNLELEKVGRSIDIASEL